MFYPLVKNGVLISLQILSQVQYVSLTICKQVLSNKKETCLQPGLGLVVVMVHDYRTPMLHIVLPAQERGFSKSWLPPSEDEKAVASTEYDDLLVQPLYVSHTLPPSFSFGVQR